MVPESGRFVVSFIQLTVVTAEGIVTGWNQTLAESVDVNDATAPFNRAGDDLLGSVLRRLTQVWVDFETRLNDVPIIDKLNRGKLRIEDYRLLLLNLHQQVIEGGRWIARAASNITIEYFPLRSMFITHAGEEHRDYQLIEHDYLAAGGSLEEIQHAEKNIGSEALSAWMFHRASQQNPFDLLGAMFIIEGLGARLARRWGLRICEQLGIAEQLVSFLLYHGANDDHHFAKLETALAGGVLTEEIGRQIVKTAKVTARLYLMQLEELGRYK